MQTEHGPEVGWFSVRRRQETRTVVDRTFGGGVVYYVGRRPRNPWHPSNQRVASVEDWRTWRRDADRIA